MTLDHSTLGKHQQNAPALRTNAPHAANLAGQRGDGGVERRGWGTAGVTDNRLNERAGRVPKRETRPRRRRASADFYVLSRASRLLSRNYLHELAAAARRSLAEASQMHQTAPSCPRLISAARRNRRLTAVRCLAVSIIAGYYFRSVITRLSNILRPRYLEALETRMI